MVTNGKTRRTLKGTPPYFPFLSTCHSFIFVSLFLLSIFRFLCLFSLFEGKVEESVPVLHMDSAFHSYGYSAVFCVFLWEWMDKNGLYILLNLSGFQLWPDYPESLLLRQNNTSKTDPRHRCVTHNLPENKILTDTF